MREAASAQRQAGARIEAIIKEDVSAGYLRRFREASAAPMLASFDRNVGPAVAEEKDE